MKTTTIIKGEKLTNEQVGQLIGLSYSAVSRLRSGNRFPSLEVMYKIEAAFDWPIQDQLRARLVGGAAKYSHQFDSRIHDFTIS